jgi:hypothetical protein
LEDDLDARIQAEPNQVVSGTTKDDKPTQGRPRPSMTLDQLEEVMPWELYPPPPSPVVHALPTSESGVAAGKRRVSFVVLFLVNGAFSLKTVFFVSERAYRHRRQRSRICNAFPTTACDVRPLALFIVLSGSRPSSPQGLFDLVGWRRCHVLSPSNDIWGAFSSPFMIICRLWYGLRYQTVFSDVYACNLVGGYI